MPVKLIGFILTLLIIISFIGFNIDNSSDIRFWPSEKGTITDVPIFVSFFVMYLIGVLSVVPFIISWRLKKNKSGKSIETDDETKESTRKNVRVLGARKKRKEESSETVDDEESVQGADLS